MKIRKYFISNSSSSSFMITNLTNQIKTSDDFAEEVSYLANDYIGLYGYTTDLKSGERITVKRFLEDMYDNYNRILSPNEESVWEFGDEDDNLGGIILDYMLRDGGETKSFKWYCVECRGESY